MGILRGMNVACHIYVTKICLNVLYDKHNDYYVKDK